MFDDATKCKSSQLHRKNGDVNVVKKFPSLQVNHQPVFQFSQDSDEDETAEDGEKNCLEPEECSAHTTNGSTCSPSRLFPPNHAHLNNSMKTATIHQSGNSVRCQSSASPISFRDREILLKTHQAHSIAASVSLESLYADDDNEHKFRPQRKRRAGISSGSATVHKGAPFASGGGNGINSAGCGRGLGGRSPQSSFDSNIDVAQISMNWMRMNGLGQGTLRPLMSNQPKASLSSTQLCRFGSLKKMHAKLSLEDRIPHSDTQCDVQYNEDLSQDLGFQRGIISGAVYYKNECKSRRRGAFTTKMSIYLDTVHPYSSSQYELQSAAVAATESPLDSLPRSTRGILRSRDQMTSGYQKQLSFDIGGTPSPTPSGRSSIRSATSYRHSSEPPSTTTTTVFNGGGNFSTVIAHLRLPSVKRRDPSKFKLDLLNQRSNSESLFRMNGSREEMPRGTVASKRRMSMAYLPREQAILKRILGPQGLNFLNGGDRKQSVPTTQFPKGGELSSRKSVSIAYSNDLEAQRNYDDSQTPLMEEKEDNRFIAFADSGGRLIKREQLHEKRKCICDRALVFGFIGIVLMILEIELRSVKVIEMGSFWSLTLKSLILASTLVLLFFVARFHFIEVQLFMNANAADDWRVSLTGRRCLQIFMECFLCALCPLPLEMGQWAKQKQNAQILSSLNVGLSICMFSRLFWLCRAMLLHSRLFTDASSRSIAGLNRVNFNARFIVKTLMTLCPGTMLMIFTASLWILAGWILRLCEREYIYTDKRKEMDYISSIWLVAITFLSIGYGDLVPHTYCGRTMAVVTGILGTCTSSMVVAVIARKLELTRAEKHVHNFMMDTQLTKKLKHTAANVLRETWLIYKFRKMVDKPDMARIRQHQRKFLVAIYELRKVKRDQRKLAENLVSLGDVAKTSSNTYELVHDVHSTQDGLSLRITAIEHQLSDISRELGALADLIRSSRGQDAESGEDDNDSVRRRRRTDVR